MFDFRITEFWLNTLVKNWQTTLLTIAITVLAGLIVAYIKRSIRKRKRKSIGIKEEKNTIIKGKSAPKSEKAKLSNNKEQEYVIDTIRIFNQGYEDITIRENDCIIIESPQGYDIVNAIPNTELGLMDLKCNCIDNNKIRVSWDTLKTDDSIQISIFAKHSENNDKKIPFKDFFDHLNITNFVTDVYVIKKRKSLAKFERFTMAFTIFMLTSILAAYCLPRAYHYLEEPIFFRIENKCDSKEIVNNNDTIMNTICCDSSDIVVIKYDHTTTPNSITLTPYQKTIIKEQKTISIDDFNENYTYSIYNMENDDHIHFYRNIWKEYTIVSWTLLIIGSLIFVYFTYKFYK